MARLEIRTPVSPTIGFYSEVALFSMALDRLGYGTDDVILKIYVGAADKADIHPVWASPPGRAKIVWVDPEWVARDGHFAQSDAVFLDGNIEAPTLAFCDADTIWMNRVDEAVSAVESAGDAVAGCNAHMMPPDSRFRADHDGFWQELATSTIGRNIPLDLTYTIDIARPAPFYPNFGFVLASSDVFRRHASDFIGLKDALAKQLELPWFAYQLALTMLVFGRGLTPISLPVTYNFPNDRAFEGIHAAALNDIRVVHYLREGNFSRSDFCNNASSFAMFCTAPLEGVDDIFRKYVVGLVGDQPPVAKAWPEHYY